MEGIKVIELEGYPKSYLIDGSHYFSVEVIVPNWLLELGPNHLATASILTGRWNEFDSATQKYITNLADIEYEQEKNHKIIQDFISLLKKDTELHYGWRCNMAMAFKDCYEDHILADLTFPINDVANKAAGNFLNLLTV